MLQLHYQKALEKAKHHRQIKKSLLLRRRVPLIITDSSACLPIEDRGYS